MDLHPWCDPPLDATNPGKCPYRTADAIAYDLYHNWSSLGLPGPVATYVVGFAPAQPQITYSSPCPTTGANAFKCDDGSTCSTGQTCSMANRTIDCTQLQTQLLGGQSLLSGPNAQGLYSCNTAAVAGLSSANQAALQVCCDLAKISYAGGTGNPYYASNANALRAQLSTILSSVSAQKTSRTPPIFSPAYSSRDSFAGQYEINSSFTIAPGQIWSGILERQRTACVASGSNPAVPTPQTYFPGGSSTYNGDDFAYNVNQWASDSQHPRRIFSAYPTIDALSVTQPYHSTWSMRWPTTASGITPTASVNAPADGVSSLAVPWRNINMWGLPTVATSSTTADGSSFLRPNGADILGGVMQVATNNCAGDIDPTRIGTGANAVVATPADANACARRIMSWALGLPQLADGNGNKPPTRPDVFGAIYRSPPVVVGPPGEAISDEAYRAYAAAQAARPIMLYTQTLDGQLHAFKVDKNPLEPARSDRLDFTVRGSTSGGSALQNEVWSFIPPAALVGIPTMYPASQQIILDGPVVVRDVRWTRFANSSAAIGSLANQNSATWKRVLVAGFGQGPDASGLNGGGYYALDVTDWANPVMLWQLTTDGLGNPLFGAGGVPVITQLFFDDPDDHFGEYPVAILPGGGSLSPSSGTTSITWGTSNSNVGNSSSYAPRTSFKGYSTSDQSRSITIVRLDTGGIVRTWRPLSSITTLQGRNAVTLTNVATTLPPNPVTGTAATFPAGTGQVANRAFIGDSEGLLWRLDLGDPSPANWKFKLFWDSYNNGICSSGNCQWKVDGTGKSATISGGQPIQQAPVLSVDRLGNLTIAYSTGDGNDYTNAARTQSGGLYQGAPVNWLVSLREQPLPTTNNSTPYWSELLWFRGFGAGVRVVGPTTLFNSTLYVTTILPQSTQTCSASDARLYGFDYIIPRTVTSSGTDYADGGAVRLTGSNANCSAGLNYIDLSKDPANSCAVSTTGVASFGVSVQQTLTCTAPTASGAGDALLGLGNHTSLTNFTTGASSPYQLVVQTGRGGSAVSNAQTNQRALALTTPPMVARIDSWAAVTE
jgi:type IV pilus assembly protein PilY1